MDDIGVQDDNLGVVQVEASEVEDVPQIKVRLAKLNDLYVESCQDFSNTYKMRTIGLEHIENSMLEEVECFKKRIPICLQSSIGSQTYFFTSCRQ